MNTKNIFRMLLVAAALLLGANNVKADETQIHDNSYNGGDYISIAKEKFANVSSTSTLRVYTTDGTQLYIATGNWVPLFYTKNDDWIRSGEYYNSTGKYFEFELTNILSDLQSSGLILKDNNRSITKVIIVSGNSNKQASSISFSDNVTMTFGGTFTAPTVTTTPADASLTYSSSNSSVARVDNNTIIPVGAGTTTITATYAGNDTYNGSTGTYTLTVSAPTTEGAVWQGAVWLGSWGGDGGSQPYLQTSSFSSVNSGDQLQIYAKVGPLNATNWNLQLFDPSWKSKFIDIDQSNATYNNGIITIDVTDAIATALKVNSNDNCAVVNGYNLTITAIKIIAGQAPADTRADVSLVFSARTGSATVGQTPTDIPTLSVTSNGQTVSGLAITYSSSEPRVATVNSSTGEVTAVAAGTTTITASFDGDDNYKPAESASYTLTVSEASQPQPSANYESVTFGNYNYRTYVTKNTVDFSQAVGLKGYYAAGVSSDGTVVQFTEVVDRKSVV